MNAAFQTIVFSTAENLLVEDFWSSRNKRKPLYKQRCVLRKSCGESQKQWMLELSNLCHCVQHPQKLTSWGFWSPRNERKPFSKQTCVLRKWCGYLRNSECWSFQTFAIVFSTPKNLLVEVSGALGMKESHFISKNVFWEMLWGISETVNAGAFKPLPLCSAKVG